MEQQMLVSDESSEVNFSEQEPLLMPVLDDNLAKYMINNVILQTKEFSKIIGRFDERDDEVKSLLVDAFGNSDIDTFNSLKEKENFLKNILKKSIENDQLEINVQQFVNVLWRLRRPQKDVCYDICNREKVIFNEINKLKNDKFILKEEDLSQTNQLFVHINFESKSWSVKKVPDLDENSTKSSPMKELMRNLPNEILNRKSLISSNELSEVDASKIVYSKKNVFLLYEANNVNDLKLKQIKALKAKLDSLSIKYQDFNIISTDENWKALIQDELDKAYAVFILYDEYLDERFDDKKNNDNNCKYKFIGKLMYREYYENKFKNFRFFTFLINNCKNLEYYWLENIHKEINANNWVKTKAYYQMTDNLTNNESTDEVDTFLLNFKATN